MNWMSLLWKLANILLLYLPELIKVLIGKLRGSQKPCECPEEEEASDVE